VAVEVRLLEKSDDCGAFQLGDEQLDLFFRRYADGTFSSSGLGVLI